MSTPKPQPACYDRIPKELRARPIWGVWRYEKRTNKSGKVRETKVPHNARTGKLAKSNDPTTWSSFDEAVAVFERGGYDGIGVFLEPPLIGADLDGCIVAFNDPPNGANESFEVEEWAKQITDELDSYTEQTPSKTGLRVIVKGELPDGRRQKEFGDREHHGVALYDPPRFIAVTGWRIGDCETIAGRTEELRRIHARLFPLEPRAKPKTKPASNGFLPDDELIAKARCAKNGEKFGRLWNGDWNGYPSQSEGDLALLALLAFWTDRDAARMDALFRRSGLMRDKWNRQDYRDATIGKAIEQTSETYRPAQAPPRTAAINLDALEPSLDLLNAMAVFGGRVCFASVSRRGSMVLATTSTDQQIVWPTTMDLTSFARSRACIAEGADVLLAQPPRSQVAKIWDPAADLIIRLAARDAVRVEHVLKAECKDLLILMWRYAGQPTAKNSKEFMHFMTAISKAVRDREAPAPPCVFTAEDHCWVHVPTFRNWLSLPALTNRLYPLADIRQGLLLLGFEYQKDVTRGADGDDEHASLWCGPIDVLLD